MSHDEELVVEYKTWKNENERINASILNEVREKSIKEGIAQGTLNTKKELVINMYNDNVSFDLISEYTGLTNDEIKDIID